MPRVGEGELQPVVRAQRVGLGAWPPDREQGLQLGAGGGQGCAGVGEEGLGSGLGHGGFARRAL